MNPALRVLKNSTALSLSVLLERGIAFFLPWYVARVQGREVWGYYSTALTFIAISASLAYWGLDQLLPRQIARDRAQAGAFLANAGVIGGAVSILVTAIVIAIVHLLHYPLCVRHLIYLGVALTLLPRTEATLCEAVINGLEKMEWIAAVRFPATILRIAGSVYLLSEGFGLEALFIALAAYYVSVCGVYLFLFKHFVSSFRLQFDWSMMRILALQAIPFVIAISMGETSKQIDRVFLSKLWDTDSVGIYSTGIMVVQIMYMIAGAIMTALFPGLSRAYIASQRRFSTLVPQLFKLILVGIFPIALAIVTFADWVILSIFGHEYTSSIVVLRVSALGIVPSFVARLLYRTILASDKEHLAIRVSFVRSITNIALSAMLIPRYGVLGASISAVCTEFVGLAQNLFCVSRKITPFDFGQALLRPGACLLTSMLVYLGMSRCNSLAAWIISTGVFVGMLLVSQTITWKDLAMLSLARRRG